MFDWLTYLFDKNIPFTDRLKTVYTYQFNKNDIFKRFCNTLGYPPDEVKDENSIPLLPIEAFKEVLFKTSDWETPEITFKSSGTSAMARSRHMVRDLKLYHKSIFTGLESFYERNQWGILAYTPGYNDNPESSLVWMLNDLIKNDASGLSRFLPVGKALDEKAFEPIKASGKKVLLFGAAFGLLDLIEYDSFGLPEDSVIIETGGMKTFRREMTRNELHERLSEGFKLPQNQIHSEYGMAELLSQAYAVGSEWFSTPHWMRISIRNPENPLEEMQNGQQGLIGIIDLANVYSCSFLLTEDVGVKRDDGGFQVLGRWKNSNLRGCNFLIDRD